MSPLSHCPLSKDLLRHRTFFLTIFLTTTFFLLSVALLLLSLPRLLTLVRPLAALLATCRSGEGQA